MSRHLKRLEGLKGLEYIRRNPGKVIATNKYTPCGFFQWGERGLRYGEDERELSVVNGTQYTIFDPGCIHYIWDPPAEEDLPEDLGDESLQREWCKEQSPGQSLYELARRILRECDRRYQRKEDA